MYKVIGKRKEELSFYRSRVRFLKIFKVYSGDSDHYYCAMNKAMDTVRLSKKPVQVLRGARFLLGGAPNDCSTVVHNVSCVCKELFL